MIYLDHNSTTPLEPAVLEAMLPFLGGRFGNPSSAHRLGSEARCAVEEAREKVAALVGVEARDVVFTSGGTEANNLALNAALAARSAPTNANRSIRVVTTQIEHSSVLEPLAHGEAIGTRITRLPVDAEGRVTADQIAEAVGGDAVLVSVGWANNEIGTLQPMADISAVCRARRVPLHSDSVQAAGKLPVDARLVDLMSLSAHKLGGPKGVGALYVRRGIAVTPLLRGGPQERERRAGTENVAGIVGFGQAALLARVEMGEESARLVRLRDRMVAAVTEQIDNAYVIGHPYRRLPGHLCLGFSGQEADAIRLLFALDDAGIAVSSGSACSAHNAGEPSYVLTAMGFDTIRARGSLRVTMGRFTSDEDIDRLLVALPEAAESLTSIASHAGFGVRQ